MVGSDQCDCFVLMISWASVNPTKVTILFLMEKMVVCGSTLKFIMESNGGFRPNAAKFPTIILLVVIWFLKFIVVTG